MNFRSGVTSTFSSNLFFKLVRLLSIFGSNRSAIAWSITGSPLAANASATAPVPRPPQPTNASFVVPPPAAWQCGKATPASAEAATARPEIFRKSRRDGGVVFVKCFDVFIGCSCCAAAFPARRRGDLGSEITRRRRQRRVCFTSRCHAKLSRCQTTGRWCNHHGTDAPARATARSRKPSTLVDGGQSLCASVTIRSRVLVAAMP